MDEKVLIGEIQNGSEQAFFKVVEQYKELVFYTCNGFVHDTVEAEDLAQEVFIELFQSIDKFKYQAKFSTWIYRIAVNKSLDLLKYKNRKKRFSGIKQIFGVDAEADNIATSENFEASAGVENQERAQILKQALDKLPQNQKIAFTLSKYDDLTYIEIAEIMNISLFSVESLLHRAKKKLQDLLYDYYQTQKK